MTADYSGKNERSSRMSEKPYIDLSGFCYKVRG